MASSEARLELGGLGGARNVQSRTGLQTSGSTPRDPGSRFDWTESVDPSPWDSQQLDRLSVELPTQGTKQKVETDREAKHMAQFGNGDSQGCSPKPGAKSPENPPNSRLEVVRFPGIEDIPPIDVPSPRCGDVAPVHVEQPEAFPTRVGRASRIEDVDAIDLEMKATMNMAVK